MANNIIRRKWNQNALVSIEDLSGSVFQAESGGHTFEISGVDNFGNTVALSGTVSAVFMRADNTDVAITGAASGGIVTVTLPAECYDVPGRFGLTVFVTADSKKTAVYAAIGTVRRTSSGNVAPGTTADVVDLINAINAAVATIPQSWSGLMADIAPTYSTSAVYPVGAYVYYDGDLYRCTTAITTAESWTAGHWTAAVLGNDVADLKSALDYIVDITNDIEWNQNQAVAADEVPTTGTGDVFNSVNFKCSNFISVDGAHLLTITVPIYTGSDGSRARFGLAFYSENKTYLSTGYQIELGTNANKNINIEVPHNAKYFRTTYFNDTYSGYIENVDFECKLTKLIGSEYIIELQDDLSDIVETNNLSYHVEAEWTANKAIGYENGREYNSTNFKASDYIHVTVGKILNITLPVYMSSEGTRSVYGLAFYNSEKEYISGSGYQMKLATDGNTAEIITVIVPENAAYMRTTWYNDDYSGYDYPDAFSILVVGYPEEDPNGYIVQLGQEEINDFFGLKETQVFPATIFGITSFIDCLGVGKLTVKMAVLSSAVSNTVGLAFYDSEKTQISFVPCRRVSSDHSDPPANSAEIREIAVPENAYYFRCSYWNFENSKLYGGDWSCSFYAPYNKRPYQSGYIFFSPKVNQAVNQYWETDLDTEMGENYLQTTGVLLLPESYTPTGKPTPIIMYFHGYSHYVYYDNWGADEAFRTQKAQWAAQGFAVMDCNGARNNNKQPNFTSGGSLQYSDGYHKCFEYVKQHYNVEQYCHIICVSAGGIPGINYCYWFNDVKSLQMLSAWTSLRNNQYGTGVTNTMVEYLACDFSDGYDATADKTVGFDPTLRIITVDGTKYLPQGKVPMKAFLGSTEQGNHIWNALQNYVTALRNAGQSVSLRIVDGATHKNICSDDILALNTEYANFCKSV